MRTLSVPFVLFASPEIKGVDEPTRLFTVILAQESVKKMERSEVFLVFLEC